MQFFENHVHQEYIYLFVKIANKSHNLNQQEPSSKLDQLWGRYVPLKHTASLQDTVVYQVSP